MHHLVLYMKQLTQQMCTWAGVKEDQLLFILTCFICSDGELIARLALADEVLCKHAYVVGGGRVQVNDGGLVELR